MQSTPGTAEREKQKEKETETARGRHREIKTQRDPIVLAASLIGVDASDAQKRQHTQTCKSSERGRAFLAMWRIPIALAASLVGVEGLGPRVIEVELLVASDVVAHLTQPTPRARHSCHRVALRRAQTADTLASDR